VSCVLPRFTIGFNLLTLLYVQRLAGLSSLSVELWRFMPSFAAHVDVALELEPHQIRSRNPSE
jgi:hypothetical protein